MKRDPTSLFVGVLFVIMLACIVQRCAGCRNAHYDGWMAFGSRCEEQRMKRSEALGDALEAQRPSRTAGREAEACGRFPCSTHGAFNPE